MLRLAKSVIVKKHTFVHFLQADLAPRRSVTRYFYRLSDDPARVRRATAIVDKPQFCGFSQADDADLREPLVGQ